MEEGHDHRGRQRAPSPATATASGAKGPASVTAPTLKPRVSKSCTPAQVSPSWKELRRHPELLSRQPLAAPLQRPCQRRSFPKSSACADESPRLISDLGLPAILGDFGCFRPSCFDHSQHSRPWQGLVSNFTYE